MRLIAIKYFNDLTALFIIITVNNQRFTQARKEYPRSPRTAGGARRDGGPRGRSPVF